MTQEEHKQEYINQLVSSEEIPFLLVTFRPTEYPNGNFIGAYSSFQNFGIDSNVCMKQLQGLVNYIKQHWDLPTEEELRKAVTDGWTASEVSGYWGIEEL